MRGSTRLSLAMALAGAIVFMAAPPALPHQTDLARLALRYDCVVLPCRVERVKGATFRLIVEDSIPLPRTGDVQADIKTLMTAVNATVERWVRSRPEQWFWLHRRWPD